MNINKISNTKSVHLQQFPLADESLIDSNLEECMRYAQQISSMILALRRKAERKVRQPLQKAVVPTNDERSCAQIQYVAALIKTEVNIKELEVLSPEVEMENLIKRIKPNFKTLGKRYGKLMKEIADVFTKMDKKLIAQIEGSENYSLSLPSGEVIDLQTDDYEIITEDMPGWLVANDGNLTVALDIEVTPALLREGIARELVNRIQNIRKASGYEITDKITVEIEKNDFLNAAVEEYRTYICSQVLANSLTLCEKLEDTEIIDFEENKLKIKVKKQI